jgi:hypothetical protein
VDAGFLRRQGDGDGFQVAGEVMGAGDGRCQDQVLALRLGHDDWSVMVRGRWGSLPSFVRELNSSAVNLE